MKDAVEKRRAALLRQRDQLMQRLAQLQGERRAVEQEIGERTADLNAVGGALQLCDSLLQELGGDGKLDISQSMLGQMLGADEVHFVPADDDNEEA